MQFSVHVQQVVQLNQSSLRITQHQPILLAASWASAVCQAAGAWATSHQWWDCAPCVPLAEPGQLLHRWALR